MKTTLELPDPLFRQVKAHAAQRGESLRAFVTEALREKLARSQGSAPEGHPLAPFFGLSRQDGDLDAALAEIDASIATGRDTELNLAAPPDVV